MTKFLGLVACGFLLAGGVRASEIALAGWHGNNESCAWAAGEGVSGGDAMGISGSIGGEKRYYTWACDPVSFKPNGVYGFSFMVRRQLSGSEILVRNGFHNYLDNAVIPDWVEVKTILRVPEEGATSALELSDYDAQGRTLMDRPRLVELEPRYRTANDVTLGRGELMTGNRYRFTSQRHCVAGSDTRTLVGMRRTNGGDKFIFSRGSEVLHRFSVAGRRLLNGRGMLTPVWCRDWAVDVDASTDGRDWVRLAVITNGNPLALAFPAKLFPAREILLRLRSEDNPEKKGECQIEIVHFEGDTDGAPLYLAGATTYVEKGTDKVFHDADTMKFRVASPGALLAEPTGAVAVWGASSGVKLFRDTKLPTRRAGALQLAAAAGEAESVQLVVTPRRALEDARVKPVGALKDDAGHEIPASAVEVLRVGYVDVRIVTDRVGSPGLWPDPLPPQDRSPFPVAKGENQPFWITVRVPAGTPRGTFRGELAVRTIADGTAEISRIPFEVEVFGFELPKRMTLRTMFGFHPNTVYDYHKAKSQADKDRLLVTYVRFLCAHHVTPYFWRGDAFPKERVLDADDPEKARVEIDFSAWDRLMELVIDECHGNAVRLTPVGLGGGNQDVRHAGAIGGVPYGAPTYERLMKDYLGQLERHLREKGWLDFAFVYWFDEPMGRDYDFVNRGMETVRKYAPSLKRMITNLCAQELMPTIDTWCPTVELLHVPLERACRDRGDTMWWYICCSPREAPIGEHIDHPGVDMRLWGWQSWGERTTGILVWATEWWTGRAAYPDDAHPQDPYLDPMGWTKKHNPNRNLASWCNGEGRYFYPPLACKDAQQEGVCLDGPVSCYRLEMLRDGIEDYEYLAMLSRLDPENPLLKVPESIYRTLYDYSADPGGMESRRTAVAREIERIGARRGK